MEDVPAHSIPMHQIEQLPHSQQKLLVSIIMLVLGFFQSRGGVNIVIRFERAMRRCQDSLERSWPTFIDRILERQSLWEIWTGMGNVEPFGIAIAMTADWDVIRRLPIEALCERFDCTFDRCRMWFCRPVGSAQSASNSTTATPRATRSGYQSTIKDTRRRDGDTCVVSGLQGPVEVCHIVPSSINGQKLAIFKEFVRGFCPDLLPRVQQLFPGSNTAIAENLMCLTPTLHSFWGAGLFALEPVSSSSTLVTVRFWWMHDLLRQITVDLPRAIPGRRRFYDSRSRLEILTGAILQFRSRQGIPAPDFTLLKVQYLMQIMGVLCGAAEPDEDGQEEEDGEVDSLQTESGILAMQGDV
ncbi:hypothetical protein Cpir12675_005579 [Ceratocystis pirilliformis]|uniref:HNH nuclease domain-containing protein n=1 Tax=Ceratocystis pirilliformis TaxID=259994 RepID=A0ABR3YP57_9PEZI